jgi:hypothetical protein
MIISLRGTNGSGKSTVVRKLMERYNAQPESLDSKGRPMNYVMTLGNGSSLYVVGCYQNACGGCDGIHPFTEIWPRVTRLAALGHVLFEGLAFTSGYGNIGKDSEVYGDDFVFAFMDTPPEVCIQRVLARREAKGTEKPYSPKNLMSKLSAARSSERKIKEVYGRRVVSINHRAAVQQILGIYYNAKRIECIGV